MDEIGLYYPYFAVRDQAWLKAAALYLPHLARVVPPGYPVNDSPVAQALREELDFFVDVAPSPEVAFVSKEFQNIFNEQERVLYSSFRLTRRQLDPTIRLTNIAVRRGSPVWSQRGLMLALDGLAPAPSAFDGSRPLAWIHNSQIARDLVEYLVDRRLAVVGRIDGRNIRGGNHWIGMDRRLVAVYSCALAGRLAAVNKLSPITDVPDLHGISTAWTADDIGRILLSRSPEQLEASRRADDIASMYVSAAVRAVVPAGLAEIPVDRIVKIRRALAPQFAAFRTHLAALSDEFDQLGEIPDDGVLSTRLADLVHQNLTSPMNELERGLLALKVKPATAVFGLKSFALPAAAAAAASTVGLPPVVSAGGAIALQLFSSGAAARRTALDKRRSAPGYLLAVRDHLAPLGVLERAGRLLWPSR